MVLLDSFLSIQKRAIRHHRRRHFRRHSSRIEPLEARLVLAADLVISEFQASNDTTILDENGDSSDWIEIHNRSFETVDLNGLFLTDDDTDLSKWQFPATTLGPDEYLVVFASDKDRATAGSELHTNFKLSSGGEYLGLIDTDGVTILSDYSPEYPAQTTDQSYGLAIGRATEVLFDGGDLKTFVPQDGSLGTDWTAVDFEDTSWTSGTAAVGYEQLAAGFAEDDDFDSPLGPEWTSDAPGESTIDVSGGTVTMNAAAGADAAADRGNAPILTKAATDQFSSFDFETNVEVTSSSGRAGLVVMDGQSDAPVIKLEVNRVNSFISQIQLSSLDNSVAVTVKVNLTDAYLRLHRDALGGSWTGYVRATLDDEWESVGTAVEGTDGVPWISNPQIGLITRTSGNPATATFAYADLEVQSEHPVYGPLIGSDTESAMFDRYAGVYTRIPFEIEGDPERFDELGMTIAYDDGYVAYLNGERVSSRNAPISTNWDSTADSDVGTIGDAITTVGINLNDNRDLLRSGVNVLAVHSLNVTIDDRDLFFDAALSGSEVLDTSQQFFIRPTPGAANDLPAATAPVFSVTGGTFIGTQTLEITTTDTLPTLEIRYTTDGTNPTADSTLYAGPISISTSMNVRAMVRDSSTNEAVAPSNITSESYIAVDASLSDRDSDIPLLVIDTLGSSFPNAGSSSLVKSLVSAYEVDPTTGRAKLVGGNLDYSGNGGLRRRGSSTGNNAKPSLAFEIWGGGDDDFDVPLLGNASESDYVLYGPFNFDRALLHEPFAYSLSRDMGRWAANTTFIEVYENTDGGIVDAGDYAGVYVLMEKIKQGKDRQDISEASPSAVYDSSKGIFEQEEAITGGYMFKIDRADPGEPAFGAGGGSLNWVYPKHPNNLGLTDADVVTPDQQAYVTAYFNEFWSVLNNEDTSIAYDPVDGYAKYIDVDSWIDNSLVNVVTMNVDAQRLSAHLFKDAGGKIEMGAVWDFDRAIESNDDRDNDPTAWRGKGGDLGTDFFGEAGNGMGGLWWRQLFDDPNFFQRYIDRYVEWRQTELSIEAIDARIDEWADKVAESAQRNIDDVPAAFRQPPRSSGCHGHVPGTPSLCDGTWRGEVENMRSWLHRRIQFMDEQFAPYVTFMVGGDVVPVTPMGVSVTSGTEIEMTSPGEGLIYYTLDGTDPRGLDGQPTASAIAYNGLAEVFTDGAMGTFHVPTGDASESGWQEIDFDDSTWETVDNRVGFDEDMNVATLRGPSGFVVRTVNASSFVTGLTVATSLLDGTSTLGVVGESERVDAYVNHAANGDGGGNFDSPPNLKPPGLTQSTTGFATRASAAVTIPEGTWSVAVTSDDGMRLTIPGVVFTNRQNHDPSKAVAPRNDELIYSGLRNNGTTSGTFTVTEPTETLVLLDHFQFFSNDNIELSIAAGDQAFDPANFTVLQDGTMGWSVKAADVSIDRIDFSPSIESDVAGSLFETNSSGYLRYPFQLDRGSDVLDLQANFRYDDGFVAYLNGEEVARFAAPESLTFNASATEERDNLVAQDEVKVSLNDHLDVLVDGQNVLAVQVLNAAVDDTDLLFTVTMSGKVKGQPLVVDENTRIMSRNFDESDRGPESELVVTDWSGLIAHDFVVNAGQLVISEINYNPTAPTEAELASDAGLDRGDFEYIEIQNVSNQPAILAGVQLTNGVDFDFINGAAATLDAGERLLVVANETAFELRYGSGLPVVGEFDGSLNNGGERIELHVGETRLFDVTYGDSDPWPAMADGDGGTLELIDPANTEPERQGKYYSWQLSSAFNGTPGTENASRQAVVINEVLTRTDAPTVPTDAIELFNASNAAVNVGGWYLSDAGGTPLKFEIPEGTTIPAGGYIVFDESDFNAPGADHGFALDSAEGDEVILVIPNPSGDAVASIVDAVEFGAAVDGETFGRVPNGTGRLAPMTVNSLGSENGSPRVGPIVITEINYNPGVPSDAALAAAPDVSSSDLEFVEILNPSPTDVNLTNWQVRGGIDFDFDDGAVLESGKTVVVISFNPEKPENANRLAAFRAHYGVSDSTPLLGGYAGSLGNGSDRIELQRPDAPPIDQPGLIPGLYEDEVLYDDLPPWPGADGTGRSLQRSAATAYGNDSQSWIAAPPTPGHVEFGSVPGDLTGDGLIDVTDINFLCGGINQPFAEALDLNSDGMVDLNDVERLVTGFLGTAMGDGNLDGRVDVVDLNRVGVNWLVEGGADWSKGDFTCDGNVGTSDLNQLGLNWQFGGAAFAARPSRAALTTQAVPADPRPQAITEFVDSRMIKTPENHRHALTKVDDQRRLRNDLMARRHDLNRDATSRRLGKRGSQTADPLPVALADVLFAELDLL